MAVETGTQRTDPRRREAFMLSILCFVGSVLGCVGNPGFGKGIAWHIYLHSCPGTCIGSAGRAAPCHLEVIGGGFLDLTKTSNYDFLLGDNPSEVSIRLPGFIQIPVCSPERARGGWKSFDSLSSSQKQKVFEQLPYYPC